MNVKTSGIMLQSLSVPCSCRCRYCLLSWDGKTADGSRSEDFARSFHDWLVLRHPDFSFNFTYGYSSDIPDLIRSIDFMNSIGSVSGRFLQMNGFAFRSPSETDALMRGLSEHGVRSVNFTFYGTETYHDRFAGRIGDFRHNLSFITAALRAGLSVSAGIALTVENHSQIGKLRLILENSGISDVRLFIPHEEGKGTSLAGIRCSLEDLERLDEKSRRLLNRNIYRTESEWYSADDLQPETRRSLLISLTPENIDRFEQIGFEETIKYVEKLDDDYYRAVPEFSALLKRYADPSGHKLYGKRDLYQHFQKIFLSENNIGIYDVTDERYCGSRRY